jgi:hypothetical protein
MEEKILEFFSLLFDIDEIWCILLVSMRIECFNPIRLHLTLRVGLDIIMKEFSPQENAIDQADRAVGSIDCWGKSPIQVALCAVGAVIDASGWVELGGADERCEYHTAYRKELTKHLAHLVMRLREAGVLVSEDDPQD